MAKVDGCQCWLRCWFVAWRHQAKPNPMLTVVPRHPLNCNATENAPAWALFQNKDCLPKHGIDILKKRQLWYHLMSVMGIFLLERRYLDIKTILDIISKKCFIVIFHSHFPVSEELICEIYFQCLKHKKAVSATSGIAILPPTQIQERMVAILGENLMYGKQFTTRLLFNDQADCSKHVISQLYDTELCWCLCWSESFINIYVQYCYLCWKPMHD